MLLCVLLAATATASAEGSFPFFFDVGGAGPADVSLSPVKRVVFGAIRECPHPCGLMPTISKDGAKINGGIPQSMNRTLHFDTLNATLSKYLSPDDDSMLDFDFEAWSPLWEKVNTSAYADGSRALVRQMHPEWHDAARIEHQAQYDWESAAKAILIDTVEFIRSVRPRVRVGMYSYPQRAYWHGYDTPSGDALRSQNDRLFPLWCHLDVLFPSVYQFYDSSLDHTGRVLKQNREYVQSNVAEAVRLAEESQTKCTNTARPKSVQLLSGRPQVLVYTWHRYHPNGPFLNTSFLCEDDESMYWAESAAAGADGLVLWGAENCCGVKNPSNFASWWNGTFAPLANSWHPVPR
jgi:hypothetical protein